MSAHDEVRDGRKDAPWRVSMNGRGTRRWRDVIRKHQVDLRIGIAVFIIAFAIYTATAVFIYHRQHSPQLAYFDHLASAFLRGELYLSSPPAGYDLTWHDGRWYVPFPPLPALLMMPLVAVFGLDGMNTAVFSAALAALNVSLTYALLRALAGRGWSSLGRGGAVWLVALFGWGSPHWLVASTGTVWFISQICTVTFVLIAALVATTVSDVRRASVAAGTALAVAMLARPHIAMAWPMLIGILAQRACPTPGHASTPTRVWPIARLGIASILPMTAAVTVLLTYNYARFGNPLDFGYLTQNVAISLLNDLRTFGQFSPHYWPRNVWAMLLALPTFNAHGGLPAISPLGLSALLTLPALVYLARAVRVSHRRCVMTGTWVALGLTVGLLLSYYNTGASQFGYRFSLDFMPEVLVLLACALPSIPWAMRALIVFGIGVNAYGVFWFTRFAGA